jgi:hypothetical protein
MSWHAFYQSELSGVWLLLPVSAAFFVFLLVSRRAREEAARSHESGFVHSWALLFAGVALLDPLLNGKLVPALGLEGLAATAAMLVFVLLGDFRVYWLVFALAGDGARHGAGRAALWTAAVPVLAYAADQLAGALGLRGEGTRLWLIHELLFTGVALWLRSIWLPRRVADAGRRRFLRAVCAFVALYYGLWAASDALWLATSADAAWLLRLLPNQLYYALFVPFVWLTHSRRS